MEKTNCKQVCCLSSWSLYVTATGLLASPSHKGNTFSVDQNICVCLDKKQEIRPALHFSSKHLPASEVFLIRS